MRSWKLARDVIVDKVQMDISPYTDQTASIHLVQLSTWQRTASLDANMENIYTKTSVCLLVFLKLSRNLPLVDLDVGSELCPLKMDQT